QFELLLQAYQARGVMRIDLQNENMQDLAILMRRNIDPWWLSRLTEGRTLGEADIFCHEIWQTLVPYLSHSGLVEKEELEKTPNSQLSKPAEI
ncbi:MAG: hypothetical protein AAF206_22065, partial [Bacteroidota bacterium]